MIQRKHIHICVNIGKQQKVGKLLQTPKQSNKQNEDRKEKAVKSAS